MFAFVINVFVDLIRDRQDVVLETKVSNHLQFFEVEDPACRIIRSVHHDCPSAIGNEGL